MNVLSRYTIISVNERFGGVLCPRFAFLNFLFVRFFCHRNESDFSLFKADMKSDILLQTAAIFFSIEPISKTGHWLGICHG